MYVFNLLKLSRSFGKPSQGFTASTDDGKLEDESLLSDGERGESVRVPSLGKRQKRMILPQVAFMISALCWMVLLCLYIRDIQQRHRSCSTIWLGHESIYSDAPSDLETFPFARAGFHRHDADNSDQVTEFEGRPNAKNDAAWHRALSVGVIAINEEENSRLPNGGSARTRHDPLKHVVLLEMFHQLHCLKYLRDLIYEFDAGAISGHDHDEYRVMHGDHCIDYLRQVIMCHGDLTPVFQEWRPELNAYAAQQDTIHQCRSFENIWKWAATRNTTGLRADGNHELHKTQYLAT